jgi:hypothetical protein
MRNVAKSFASFTWAMGMFGVEQLTNLLSEERSGNRQDRLTEAFESMTKATGEVLSDRTKSMFDSGDRFQREMVDLTFDVFRPESWSPEKMFDRAADLAESTAEALRGKETEETAESEEAAASTAA